MEEILQKLIEEHELNIVKYTQERDERNAKMKFVREHKFEREFQHLYDQKEAVSDIFYDYRKAIEDLRKILNDWNS